MSKNQYKLINKDKLVAQSAVRAFHGLLPLQTANMSSETYKSLKLKDLPSVESFINRYTESELLDSIDIYIMNGTIYLDSNPIYALFYDGNEKGFDKVSLLHKNGFLNSIDVSADSPIILISEDVYSDEFFLETTVVHELSHFIDGLPSGEEIARRMEYNFLVLEKKISKDDANKFLKYKYS